MNQQAFYFLFLISLLCLPSPLMFVSSIAPCINATIDDRYYCWRERFVSSTSSFKQNLAAGPNEITFSKITNAPWSPRGWGDFAISTTSYGFSAPDGTSRQVSPGNLFAYGDAQYPINNDVWTSSDGGQTWTLLAGISWMGVQSTHAASPYDMSSFTTQLAGQAQGSNGMIFRLAGQRMNGAVTNEVWQSVDGRSWTMANAGARFTARIDCDSVVDPLGRIWNLGGDRYTGAGFNRWLNDVWMSANGLTWVQKTNLPWFPRAGSGVVSLRAPSISGVAIIAFGGYMQVNPPFSYCDNQVVATFDDGLTWSVITSHAAWLPRHDIQAETTDAGLIVIAGGANNPLQTFNDVWVSPDGGYTWGRCVQDAEWSDRLELYGILDPNGYLLIGGGVDFLSPEYLFNDIWRSSISFNDLNAVSRYCGISIPSCGVGLKCLPTDPSFMWAANGRIYCDACPYPSGGSSGPSDGAAIAFLVIFLLMFLITLGTLGYTYWKLREHGQASPIPLPNNLQRWWNKGGSQNAIKQSSELGRATNEENGLYTPLALNQQL